MLPRGRSFLKGRTNGSAAREERGQALAGRGAGGGARRRRQGAAGAGRARGAEPAGGGGARGPMELENIVANTVLLKAREGERRRAPELAGRQARAAGPGGAAPGLGWGGPSRGIAALAGSGEVAALVGHRHSARPSGAGAARCYARSWGADLRPGRPRRLPGADRPICVPPCPLPGCSSSSGTADRQLWVL